MSINRQRAENAQKRIKRVVAELLNQGVLPEGKTARMKAIAREAKCSFSTLQKYEDLWLNPSAIIPELEPDIGDLNPEQEAIAEEAAMASVEQLQGKPPLKVGSDAAGIAAPASSSVRKGEGAGRRERSSSQPQVPFSGFASELECFDSIRLIMQVQAQIRRLGWTMEQMQDRLEKQFGVKQPADLMDDELEYLLDWLQQQRAG